MSKVTFSDLFRDALYGAAARWLTDMEFDSFCGAEELARRRAEKEAQLRAMPEKEFERLLGAMAVAGEVEDHGASK